MHFNKPASKTNIMLRSNVGTLHAIMLACKPKKVTSKINLIQSFDLKYIAHLIKLK